MESKSAINDNKDDTPLIEVNQPNETLWKDAVNVIRSITVEPLCIAVFFVHHMYDLISKQYVYDYVARSNGFNTSTQSSSCENSSSLEDKVSAESSQWVLYLNIAAFAPALMTTIVVASWGDSVGRRLPLLVGFFGFLVLVCNFLIVLCFDLPIYYLFIGTIVNGLCGERAIILSCIYAYLADTSTKENRTFRVAVGQFSCGIGGIIGSLLSGFWVGEQGYIPPVISTVVIQILSILYILFILPESRITGPMSLSTKIKLLFSKQPFVAIKDVFIDFNHFLKIFGISICFFIQVMVANGFSDIMVIYELSPPFCWNSVLIGYSSAMRVFPQVANLVFIKILSPCSSDYFIVVLGIFSNISCLMFYAFSTVSWMLFVGLATGWVCDVIFVVLRSVSSKLVSKESQGSIFALLAQVESIAWLVATFIANPLYSATISWFSGFVFIIIAAFQVVVLFLFSIVYYNVRKDI